MFLMEFANQYFHFLHHHLQTIRYQMVQVSLLVMQLVVRQLQLEHQYLQVLLQDLDQVFQQHQLHRRHLQRLKHLHW